MPLAKIRQFLDSEKIKYRIISHSVAYTAQEIAALAHISGKTIAKTVIVKLDGKLAMTVLQATQLVDLDALAVAAGAKTADLATEREFSAAFPDCDLGAMPPFGNLYGMPVFVSEALARDDEIAFNACSHTELIRLAFSDFERVVKPRIVHLERTPTPR
ncbi:MAG: YbaK/EbsC family protein [Candidatus Eisenbacteria bacterium]|nr:YbaK/EbsC family protein [Candidatus Eisenbacteria bacterium]